MVLTKRILWIVTILAALLFSILPINPCFVISGFKGYYAMLGTGLFLSTLVIIEKLLYKKKCCPSLCCICLAVFVLYVFIHGLAVGCESYYWVGLSGSFLTFCAASSFLRDSVNRNALACILVLIAGIESAVVVMQRFN